MKLNTNIFPINFEVPDIAYGLTGGSLLGAYVAGVLTSHGQIGLLQKANLIMGTSVGSINGALAAKDWNTLAPLWESITDSSKVWKGDINNKFTDVWGALFTDSMLDPSPLYSLIDKNVGSITMEELSKIHDIELIFPASSNNSHQLKFFSSFGDCKQLKVSDIVEASAAIPIGLKSKSIIMPDGTKQWFSDGGVGANNPFIAVHEYNKAFPNNRVKKLILIFCGDDKPAYDNKEYKLARDVGINQIQTVMSIQEQMAEEMACLVTSYGVIDVCAIYHKGGLGNSFVADPKRLQTGYDDGVSMIVWDYRTQQNMNLIDFLKRT